MQVKKDFLSTYTTLLTNISFFEHLTLNVKRKTVVSYSKKIVSYRKRVVSYKTILQNTGHLTR